MKLLFTNQYLRLRTGSELVAAELACGMRRRGHDVAAYAPECGPLARQLTDADVRVVDNLADLGDWQPDVIHGQHNGPATAAAERFPGVPMVFACHSGTHPMEQPPASGRIATIVAVDYNCRHALTQRNVLDEDDIIIVPNAVDLHRFQPRDALPVVATRAAVYSNYMSNDNGLIEIRRGCDELGIDLDVIGAASGNSTETPELLLGAYDVVFAKARCALEALAVGCAVIVADTHGIGPMVDTVNLGNLRAWNFGFRTMQRAIQPELVVEGLRRYNATDATAVSEMIRASASLESALDTYESLYSAATSRRLTKVSIRTEPPTAEMMPLPINVGATLRVSADTPRTMEASRRSLVSVRIHNGSRETLVGHGKHACVLVTQWFRDGVALHTPPAHNVALSADVESGQTLTMLIDVTAPDTAGSYTLQITPGQLGLHTFNQHGDSCYASREVDVVSGHVNRRPPLALTALLAESPVADDVRVVRDATVATLGFVDHPTTSMLTWVSTTRFVRYLAPESPVSAVLCTPDLADLVPDHLGLVISDHPQREFYRLHNWLAATDFYGLLPRSNVHPTARIDPRTTVPDVGVTIAAGAVVGAHVAFIGRVDVGAGAVIGNHVSIGTDAFQMVDRDTQPLDLVHVGGVTIGDRTRLFDGAIVARGPFMDTEIGSDVRIGNNAFVSHRCQIGDRTVIGHGAVVNGNVVVGTDAWIGPGAVITNSINVGSNTNVALGSTVIADLADGQRVAGAFAINERAAFRHFATARKP